MKLFKNAKNHAIAIRFLLSYLIILCFPLIIGIIIYDKTVAVVEAEVVHTNLTVLEQSKVILDGRLADIEANVQHMIQNYKVNSFQFVQDPYKGSNTYRILDTRRGLNEYTLTNSFVLGYYLLFDSSELVLSANSTYNFTEFYQDVLHYENMDYTTWHHEFLDQYRNQYLPTRTAMLQGKSYEILTYIKSMGNPSYHKGSAVVLVDNSHIKSLLKGLNLSNGGWAYIADNTGRIVSYVASGKESIAPLNLKFNNSKGVIGPSEETNHMMVTYTVSAQNGWTYVAVQPPGIVLEKANYIKQLYYWITSVMLLLGCIVALVLAYRNSKPVRNLVRTISEHLEAAQSHRLSDTYRFISDSFSKLIQNNEELQIRLKEQQPILRVVFFERLFKGGFKTEEDLKMLMQHVGINMSSSHFLVVVLHLSGYYDTINRPILEELDVRRMMLSDVLRKMVGENGYVHHVEEDKIALLLICKSDDLSLLEQKILEIADWINELTRQAAMTRDFVLPEVKLAVGGICETMHAISASYEEALMALNYLRKHRDGKVLWFHEVPKENSGYYYPADMETRLINFAKTGDSDNVRKVLAELHKQNFVERNLSLHILRLMVNVLWGSIVKAIEQLGLINEEEFAFIQMEISQLDSAGNPEGMFPSIVDTFEKVCIAVNKRKKSHNEQLKQNVLEYIRAQFANSELNLDAVSAHFQISMKYLSQFFKEQTGAGFAEYVNTIRMEAARTLLLTSDLSINEIAQRIGFLSSNVFCRAFKRMHGMSPNVYRRSLGEPLSEI